MTQSVEARAGDAVGPYVIVRHLNSGGMGAVYVAAHATTGATVALKIPGERTGVVAERFSREARIAARLDHAHIVRTLASNGPGESPYLAMELLQGVDLEARLRGGRVLTSEALRIAEQVCEALQHAHEQRVVHRDLKPGNIFLGDGPSIHVKVLDFGIARLQDEVGVTRTGSALGTVAYMPPEQARGERDVDARADLWSLGVVLYECLAGRPPFVAATVAGTLFQIVASAPPDLATLRPDLPRELVGVVARALQKSRDRRYPDAAAMRCALRAIGDIPELALSATAAVDLAESTDDEGAAEMRLVSVAYLEDVSDHALVGDLTRRLGGRVVPLRGDAMLALFGADAWFGDEPVRATRLAASASVVARRVSVSTGRAARTAAGVVGQAVDAAVAAATEEGVVLDQATADIVRDRVPLDRSPGGRHRPAARAEGRGSTADGEVAFASPFVGRDGELAMLLQAIDDAEASARPVGVLVCGTEGIGKSRLRFEATRQALAHGATCLVARCEVYQLDAPFAALGRALAARADPALVSVFTEPSQRADPQAGMDHARSVFLAHLRDIAAGGAIVLAVDDAQWLDGSSIRLLRGLCELADDLPLALWMFTRPEGRETLTSILPSATVRELPSLPRAAAERLLRAIVGTAPDAVLDRAGGHPLFVEELGRLFATRRSQLGDERRGAAVDPDDLPLSVQGAILAQLDRFQVDEREFIKRAAIFGNSAWVEGVSALGGDARLLQTLRRLGVFAPRAQPRFAGTTEFAFRSHLVREVAFGLWPDAQRARARGQAAAWLEENTDASPSELATHWEAAGEAERAGRAHARAARCGAAVGDVDAVGRHVARALALSADPWVRWDALVARDDVLQLTADRALQREGLDELEVIAWGPGATLVHRATVAWRRCYVARISAEHDLAETQGLNAIRLADEALDATLSVAARIEMALLRANQGRAREAQVIAQQALGFAACEGGSWIGARARATLGYALAEAGVLTEASSNYRIAAEAFARAGDLRRAAVIHGNAATVLIDRGSLAEADSQLRAAIEAAQRVGNRAAMAISQHNLGVVLRLQGASDGARELQARAMAEGVSLRAARLVSAVATERVYLALAEPPVDDIAALAAGALEAADATGLAPLKLSATAAAARAFARVDAVPAELRTALRAAAGGATPALTRVEVVAALRELRDESCGARDIDRALEAALVNIDDVDRDSCLDVIARRFVLRGLLGRS